MYIVCASVCYRDYCEDEIGGMISDAGKAGYKFVELHGPKFWDVDAIDVFNVQEMKKNLDEAGLKCTGIYPPGFGGKNDEDVERRAIAMAKSCGYIENLGGDYVGTSGAEQRDGDNIAILDRAVKMINGVLELTPDSKVLLGIENHRHNAFEQISDYDYVLSRVKNPRAGVTVDTGHFYAVGIDVGYGRGLTVELEHSDLENTLFYVREALAYFSGLLGRLIV